MNHYWIPLYLFLLLYNIHIYLESSYTYGITPDSPTPPKAEILDLDYDDEIIVVDKNKPVNIPSQKNTSNNNPRTLASEQAVGDSKGGTNVTDVIELDLTERTSTAFYDYAEQGNVESYIPKPGIAFGLIKIKTGDKKNDPYQVIWRAKEIVANLVSNVKKTNKVSVFLENGNIIHYIKSENEWVQRSNYIEIDINIKKSTYEFIYNEEGYTRIYEPRGNFLITKVVFGTCKLGCKSYVNIWEAKSPDEYSNKLKCSLNIIEPSANEVIELYSPSGKMIKLVNRNNKWFPVDPNKDLAFKISINWVLDSFYYYILNYLYYKIFVARKGFVFNGLIQSNPFLLLRDTFWETHNPDEYSYKVLVYGKDLEFNIENVIIFHLNGNFTHFSLIDKKWVEVDPSEVVDISSSCNGKGYDRIKDDYGIQHFVPFGKLLFKGVKSTEGLVSKFVDDIWNAKSRMDYAKEVLIITSGKNKYLVILLIKNRYVIFFKSELVKKWTDYTDDQHTLLELKLLGFDLSELIPYSKDGKEPVKVLKKPEPTVLEQAPISEPRTNILIDLDISKMLNIKEYDIIYGQNKVTFRARGPYLFKIVKNGNEILWQPKNNIVYLYKVIYKVVDNNPKIKVYIHDDKVTPRIKPSPMTLFNLSEYIWR